MSQKPKRRSISSWNSSSNSYNGSSITNINDESEQEALLPVESGGPVTSNPSYTTKMLALSISNTIDHYSDHDSITTSVLDDGSNRGSNHSQTLFNGEYHNRDLDDSRNKTRPTTTSPTTSMISSTGLSVLLLLAIQNCSKNLLMRYVMKDKPKFLTSVAVIGSELIKLMISTFVIIFYEKKTLYSIIQFVCYDDKWNTILVAVPASAYNLQMKLEYIALANIDAAMFSVLVQTKLLFTATFSYIVLRKKLKYIQVISLLLLTVGVMLCNMKSNYKQPSRSRLVETTNDEATTEEDEEPSSYFMTPSAVGIISTIGIALSSGFASVYTEKIIKGQHQQKQKVKDVIISTRDLEISNNSNQNISNNLDSNSNSPPTSIPLHHTNNTTNKNNYGLWHTQVQLAVMSLITIGIYALYSDYTAIATFGLFHQFTFGAFVSIFNSAIGGLIVASVLKYADSILKGYATATSVILTGILSMILFHTPLPIIYFMGIVNVVTAVLLYNGKDMDHLIC